jgi:AcrR family transcriptional regulator
VSATAGELPGVRRPRQLRSEDSLRRIVRSARETLETKSFEEATLSELVAGAGLTTGAFYARFDSKEALLDYLEREAYDDLRSAMVKRLALREPPVTVEQGIRQFLTAMSLLYREHRGVVRAILLASRSDPERNARRMKMARELLTRGVETLLGLEGPIRHPDPPRAVRIALLFTVSALRDVMLFDEDWLTSPGEEVGTTELVDELTLAAVAYLERDHA